MLSVLVVYCGQGARGYAVDGLEELRVHLEVRILHQIMDRSLAVPGGRRAAEGVGS